MTTKQRRRCAVLRVLIVWLLLGAPLALSQMPPQFPPTVVFMTDFGVVDDSVALCKGVMYSVLPALRIVDLSHQVTPFSVLDGARYLFGATPYFPAGTVFVVVIDPGVGSSRKAIIVKSKRGQFFVLPDNGLMTMVADRDGLEAAHEITNRDWMIGAALSSTFHGRDIFSPAGAHVARGEDWTQAGPALDVGKLVRLDIAAAKSDEKGLTGAVIGLDGPFGNLVTNISAEDFMKLGYARGETVPLTIGSNTLELRFVHTFADVALHQPLLYIDSRGRLAAAVNQGNFAETYHVAPPMSLSIPRKK